jgi:hypothetical protein
MITTASAQRTLSGEPAGQVTESDDKAYRYVLRRTWADGPHPAIVKEGELPPGWGMLVIRTGSGGARLAARVTPHRRQAAPIPPETLASLLYAVQKTAVTRSAA